MKIPIREAINSGTWFRCITKGLEETIIFKLRVLSFKKNNLSSIDEPEKLTLDEGILWLMGIDVISLNKEEAEPSDIHSRVILFDQDGFKFNAIYDQHLNLSEFGKSVGIKRFTGWSDVPKLKPKIKATGALPFLLPDDDTAEYYISVEGGNIQEI
ncbi:MAG: hypothetical protein A2Y81_12330 [Nitrospirae bacterium RBG_13_43_8]|nr:MAG: hypothetical protein A2Y81_12330 [Nitrospirae bacterium RBG_13_43_8]